MRGVRGRGKIGATIASAAGPPRGTRIVRMWLALGPALLLTLVQGSAPVAARGGSAAFADSVQPFFADHCYGCHSATKAKGGLNLKRFEGDDPVAADPDTWEKIAGKIRTGEMPPEDEERPSRTNVEAVTGWIDDRLASADRAAPPDADACQMSPPYTNTTESPWMSGNRSSRPSGEATNATSAAMSSCMPCYAPLNAERSARPAASCGRSGQGRAGLSGVRAAHGRDATVHPQGTDTKKVLINHRVTP